MSQTKATRQGTRRTDTPFDATDHVVPADDKVAKRANWEAFEFEVLDDGNVEVVNKSHDDPEAHTYVVVMDEQGVPKWCLHKDGDEWEDCPARKWHCDHEPAPTDDEPHEVCKHSYAVARSMPLISAVRTIKQD